MVATPCALLSVPPPPPKLSVIPPPPPGLPPPPPEKLAMSLLENPCLLVLLAVPIKEYCSSLFNLFQLPCPSYLLGAPAPPVNFPKLDWFLSFFTFKFIAVSSVPSSIPVNMAWSDLRSYTCILSIASAGKFLVAILGSPVKNSFPFTNTLVTVFPFTVIPPDLSTSMPGIFFNKSSTTALGGVLKFSALNSIESPLITTGGLRAVTVTVDILLASSK